MNNRLKHDKRTAGMIHKAGGFHLLDEEEAKKVSYPDIYHRKRKPDSSKLCFAPFCFSRVAGVYWLDVGDIPPENKRFETSFRNEKKAYQEHFEERFVVDTLRQVLNELGISIEEYNSNSRNQ